METKTKVLIGIGAVAVLGTTAILIARHFKKKKQVDMLPETTDSNALYDEPAPQPATATSTSTTTSQPVTNSVTAKVDGSNYSIGYTYDKAKKTVSISAMGVHGTYKMSNVKKAQQYVMNSNTTLKDEMSKHGGADGKLGDSTAKCFAIFITIMSQTEVKKEKLATALQDMGVTIE